MYRIYKKKGGFALHRPVSIPHPPPSFFSPGKTKNWVKIRKRRKIKTSNFKTLFEKDLRHVLLSWQFFENKKWRPFVNIIRHLKREKKISSRVAGSSYKIKRSTGSAIRKMSFKPSPHFWLIFEKRKIWNSTNSKDFVSV